jgi:lipopolysaccharide transport system ATP-binding protein
MSAPAVEVRKVSKRYSIGATAPHRSLVDTLGDYLRGGVFSRADRAREFWALNDVSFEIAPGEAIALIGQNGAGKSTLLKILSRITEPTTGLIRYRGTVGSLLEIGAGFHYELSGRDNIYLSGAVLGMTRAEIRSKFDQIVDFAGIDSYIDEPVKHYSSGMYVRLAFAVAAHLDTDILLVDEVLAVGDAAFQQKCLGRMESVAREGRTVVFVSHNLTAVQALCRRALWIKEGRLIHDGAVADAVGKYLTYLSGNEEPAVDREWHGDTVLSAAVTPISARAFVIGDPEAPIDTASAFAIEWDYDVSIDRAIDLPVIDLHDSDGLLVFNQAPWEFPVPMAKGTYRTRCIVPAYLLNDGRYAVSLRFTRSGETVFEVPRALIVDVIDSGEARFGWYGKWPGVIRPKLEWKTELLPHARRSRSRSSK